MQGRVRGGGAGGDGGASEVRIAEKGGPVKTLVTVDWDFFVNERPEWDMGHRENLLFLKMLWSTRGGLVDKMVTSGDEDGFWSRLREELAVSGKGRLLEPLWVSDSHCYAYSLLEGVSRVVLFDAHHDCWTGENGQVMCDNWLRTWLKGSSRRKATWVRPPWLNAKVCRLPEDMEGRVEAVTYGKGMELALEGLVAVHACRSGCWTPPWLDKAFLGFLEGFGNGLEGCCRLQEGEWDPMAERWTEKDLAEALDGEAKVRSMVAGMRTGSVPSGNFLNARVEVAVKVPVR